MLAVLDLKFYFRRLPADQEDAKKEKDPKYRFRPLYDIPYMFEAREFLRKKLIGKKVMTLSDECHFDTK